MVKTSAHGDGHSVVHHHLWFRACREVTAIMFALGFIFGGGLSGYIVHSHIKLLQGVIYGKNLECIFH